MRAVVLGILALHGLFANLDAADKTWAGGISGDWFDAMNWSPPGAPQPSDSVAVTTATTIVMTDNVVIASLELRRAGLVVSNRLTVTNLVLSDGAWLRPWVTPPSPLTNPPPDSGIIEIPAAGHLEIGTNGSVGIIAAAFRIDGAKLNLYGTGNCSSPSGILLFFLSQLNVYGTLNVSSEFNLDGANGPPGGSLNVYGMLNRSGGTNFNFLSANLTNRGTVRVQSGTMNMGNGLNSGLMNISFGATQSFAAPLFVWEAGGRFNGDGTVRLVRGTFDCGTNDLLIPNLHWATPGAALQGTNSVTVNEASWDTANATGAGDVIVTGHLALRSSSPGTPGAAFRGTRRLVNRGKASFATNSTLQFLDRSSFRNEGYVELGPGAAILGFAAASPHPDVSVLNFGTIISDANTTNTIWIRLTNSGNLQVNGRLQLQDQNAVQTRGNTIVSGLLSVLKTYRVDGGLLSGTGVVQGIVRSAGTIAPGTGVGQLNVLGSVTNHGIIAIEVGNGSISDVLSVSNHFRLGGSLAVRYADIAWPTEGTAWEVLRFGSSSGSFNSIQGLDLGGGHVLQPIFSLTNLVLVLSNQPPQRYTFTTLQFTPGELELHFTADAGRTNVIDVSSDLISWTPLLVTNSPDGIIYFRDSLSAAPQRFYRAREIE